MVPRPDMTTVDADATVSEAATIAIQAGYSRLPMIGESKDDVRGLIHAKDILRALQEGKDDAKVATLARPAHYCPESKRVSELMREMQAQKFHMAVVVDEYGGTAGLVTLEDLIEELVGEIVDEYDVEEARYERLPNGELRVDSRMLIDDLNELLGVEWPSEDWDSVGGLVLNRLGHVASEGETVEYEGHLLRAEKVKGRRIGRVRITRVTDDDDERDADRVAVD
jgi:CBS domain containing-hemolysin-like protein